MSRPPPTWRRWWAVVVGVVLAIPSGCTAGGSDEPGPTPTATLTLTEVYSRIDLAGPADTPLYWEIAGPTDPLDAAAVAVAQRYEALKATLFEQADRQQFTDRDLLPHLATAPEVARLDRILRMPPNPRAAPLIGPRWITLLEVRLGEREAVVVMCFDNGYWGRSGLDGPPRPDGLRRSDVAVYRLAEARPADTQPQWKVDQVTFHSIPVSEPRLALTDDEVEANQHRCADWAVHTPEDVPDEAPQG